MEAENNQTIERLEKQRKRDALRLEQEKTKKVDHVRYFHDHIINRLKLNAREFEAKLKSQMSNIQSELDLKNKMLLGNATSSDFDKVLETIKANNHDAILEKDKEIEKLKKDLNELKSKLDSNVHKAKADGLKRIAHLK